VVIQAKTVTANLDTICRKLEEIETGTAQSIETRERASAVWAATLVDEVLLLETCCSARNPCKLPACLRHFDGLGKLQSKAFGQIDSELVPEIPAVRSEWFLSRILKLARSYFV
jgi:hypothetical protein